VDESKHKCGACIKANGENAVYAPEIRLITDRAVYQLGSWISCCFRTPMWELVVNLGNDNWFEVEILDNELRNDRKMIEIALEKQSEFYFVAI
jgi:hypothetical protein